MDDLVTLIISQWSFLNDLSECISPLKTAPYIVISHNQEDRLISNQAQLQKKGWAKCKSNWEKSEEDVGAPWVE